MLLNEFLKERPKVEEQELEDRPAGSETCGSRRGKFKALTAGFQKVSAQLESEEGCTTTDSK